MGESLLLITIITLIVLTVRRNRPVVLENPVVIQRSGQYHITLAPQLNRAQSFIEQIVKQLALSHTLQGDISSQYFEVRDPKVFAQGESYYLLTVNSRDGMLYFRADNPKTSPPRPVIAVKPAADETGAEQLCTAVEAVARQLGIAVKVLQETA